MPMLSALHATSCTIHRPCYNRAMASERRACIAASTEDWPLPHAEPVLESLTSSSGQLVCCQSCALLLGMVVCAPVGLRQGIPGKGLFFSLRQDASPVYQHRDCARSLRPYLEAGCVVPLLGVQLQLLAGAQAAAAVFALFYRCSSSGCAVNTRSVGSCMATSGTCQLMWCPGA